MPSGKTRWSDRVGHLYGLRVLAAWGFGRTLRLLGVVLWVGLLADVILVARPDLLHTADFGTDTSNYVAFGERLADRQPLYALSPGDRPVGADNPPQWTVPILSPPQMALPWAAMTVLPDAMRFYGPWAIGLAGTIAVGLLFMQRAPALLVLVTLPSLNGLALTAWSGNVNALIAPSVMLIWWAGRREDSRLAVIATGALAAMLGAVKIGPSLLWAWLIGRRPSNAIAGGLLAAGVLTGAVAAFGGVGVFHEYFLVAVGTASEPSASSLTGVLVSFGLTPDAARVAWLGVVILVGLSAFLSRRSPVVAFAAAAAGLVLLTPVVRNETIALALVVAGTPWTAASRSTGVRPHVAISACTAGVMIGVSIATGGLVQSSMYLGNATAQPVIVRFPTPGQSASWGYLVQAGEVGIGWSDQTGAVLTPLRIFDLECHLVAVVDVSREGGSYRLDSAGIKAEPLPSGAAYLLYDSRCSDQMPKFGVQAR